MIYCHPSIKCRGAFLVASIIMGAISGVTAVAAPMDQDVFTNFEAINTTFGTPFDVGTGDAIATFSGDARSAFAGIGELYKSGSHSWMVGPAGVGTITFERNAAVVEFFAIARSGANGNTIITAFDDANAVVSTPVTIIPFNPFQLVSFTGNINRIDIQNFATGSNFSTYNGIDDFGYTPIAPFTPTADFDDDGDVDGNDFLTWQRGFGSGPGAKLEEGDGNNDGEVDADDLALWEGSFAATGNVAATVSAVPEPTTMVLLLGALAAVGALGRHRSRQRVGNQFGMLCIALWLWSPCSVMAQGFDVGADFEGANSAASGTKPPDTMGATGPNHVVQLINGRYRFYDKTGIMMENRSLNSFWNVYGQGFNGSKTFDPRVVYDPHSRRFFAAAVDSAGGANNFLVAVSKSDNPADGWTGFKIDADTDNQQWPDFPQLGFSKEGVYISANMFTFAGSFQEINMLVLPKADLLAPTSSIANRTLLENVLT